MKFNINNYKGKYAMHCKTEDEAREFCDYLHSVGRKWHDGEPYLKKKTLWYWDEEDTCYNFNKGYVANRKYYLDNNYTILEWSDFTTEFTKADLKDGMVVEFVNGNKYFILNNRMLDDYGYVPLSEYNDNLEYLNKPCHKFTIKKAYKLDAYAIGDILNDNNLTLIWERKEKPEPVEMTIEEVCKALGKEIKIVKG